MSEKPRTIKDALTIATGLLEAAGVDTPRLDAQLLLAWALKLRREDLAINPDGEIGNRAALIFWKALDLRCDRRPLPYITGEAWFYGRPFKVNRAVLIPRPETEMIVDFVKSVARSTRPLRVADIGTGSGCIGVSVALEIADSLVDAVDISPLALRIAGKNVQRHGVTERVTLIEGDLLNPLEVGETYDLIVSNPPYIPVADRESLMPEVRVYEPEAALFGIDADEHTPMQLRTKILIQSMKCLKAGGHIAIEIGIAQRENALQVAQECGYDNAEVLIDFAGIGRLLVASK